MIATAWAQQAGATAAGAPSPVLQLLPFALVFVVFYLLVIRPEQKKRQQQQEMLANLKRNDAVVLSSGIHGRVMTLGEEVVSVEIAPRVQVQIDRSAIQRIVGVEDPEKERQRS